MTPRYSEEQQQQRELNARHDLEKLVKLLMDAASDIWRNPKISGRDRALHFGRGATLLATVDRLSQVILDLSDAGVRADRLADLHDMLEAAAILADGVKAPVAHRLRIAAAINKRVAGKAEKKRIIAEELAKLGRTDLPDKARAGHIQKRVGARAKPELEIGTITKYIRELRAEQTD
jgi:hypothetical protein